MERLSIRPRISFPKHQRTSIKFDIGFYSKCCWANLTSVRISPPKSGAIPPLPQCAFMAWCSVGVGASVHHNPRFIWT